MIKRRRLFILNNQNAPRLSPELATEIGLNESIILLQIEFWISISDHFIDGKYWTYQSIRDIQKTFSFWSHETINRAINSLIKLELLDSGNYNQNRYDKTRWFSLNEEGISKLKSISINTLSQNETTFSDSQGLDDESSFNNLLSNNTKEGLSQNVTPLSTPKKSTLSQNETTLSQNETALSQDVTTIPETTPETTPENSLRNNNNSTNLESDNIFKLYDENIEKLSSMNSELLKDAEETYGSEKVTAAIGQAVKYNKKNWAYIEKILQNGEKNKGVPVDILKSEATKIRELQDSVLIKR
jgi:DnaD/phage-associated family protein